MSEHVAITSSAATVTRNLQGAVLRQATPCKTPTHKQELAKELMKDKQAAAEAAQLVVQQRAKRLHWIAVAVVVAVLATVAALQLVWFVATIPAGTVTETAVVTEPVLTTVTGWELGRLNDVGGGTLIGLLQPVGWFAIGAAIALIGNKLRMTSLCIVAVGIGCRLSWQAYQQTLRSVENPTTTAGWVIERGQGIDMFELAFFAGAILMLANIGQTIHLNRGIRRAEQAAAEAAGTEPAPSVWDVVGQSLLTKSNTVLRTINRNDTGTAPKRA